MMKIAPDPVDIQDLQFKLQCRLKIFDNTEGNLTKISRNLIAAASRYGLIFVGCNSPKLKVIRFASIEDYSSSESIANYSRREISLESVPEHISVNCEHTKLAVIVKKDNCPVALFYDVQSFFKQNIIILNEVRLSTTPDVKVLEANWHPTIGAIFTECKVDGTLGVYELKEKSVDICRLPAESNATCFCWSPKGKQIAVGSKDGKLTHYKPDLKAVKVITAPPFDKPHTIISLQWISNYQFLGVFQPLDSSEDQCSIVLIDAPKTGNPSFTNFYDICYSNGSFRSPQFYMIFEHHWNIMIVASANSMEVGVLASTGDSWTQWSLSDSARAELPLDENREETYPVGIAIDTSSVKPVPWGESSLQPAPSLLLLSHQGVLCCFKIINLKEGAPSINSPPENVADLSGLGTFTTGNAGALKHTAEISKIVPQMTKPSLLQQVQQQASNQPSQVTQQSVLQQAHQQGSNQPSQTTQQSLLQQLSGQQFQATQQPVLQQIQQQPPQPFQTPKDAKSPLSGTTMNSASQFILPSQNVTIEPLPKTPLSTQSQPTSSVPFATSLFGNSVTLTPNINKSSQNNATSLVGSMLLNAGNNFSPKVDGSNTIFVTPKSSQPFSSIGQSAVPSKVATPQPKIVVPVTITQTPTKPHVQTTSTTSLASSKSIKPVSESQENSQEIEKILAQMVYMEYSALENELKVILHQGKQLKINLDPNDMDTIVHKTKDIDDFIKELIETSDSQTAEIHILKQNTVQSWAWLEEARSRFRESQNKELKALLKSKPLDSVSEKHLITLKQMEYYLNSQLSQAHTALDEQWDKFQEYCRKINRVQLPTMEAIFQTMVKQNAILQKQDYILKDIYSQIKGKKKLADHGLLFNPLKKSLEDSFQNLKLEPEDIYRIHYRKVLNRVRSLPSTKANQLRVMLRTREVPHVMAKSQMLNSVLQTTPERKNRSIMVQMTPTTKPSEMPRNLNFYQSTPLNIKAEPPSTTHIASSPLSAFAPTNTVFPNAKSQISSNFPKFGNEPLLKESMPKPSTSLSNFTITNMMSTSCAPTSSTEHSDNQMRINSTSSCASNSVPGRLFVVPTTSSEAPTTIFGDQSFIANSAGIQSGKQTPISTSKPLFSGTLQSSTPALQSAPTLSFSTPKSISTSTSVTEIPTNNSSSLVFKPMSSVSTHNRNTEFTGPTSKNAFSALELSKNIGGKSLGSTPNLTESDNSAYPVSSPATATISAITSSISVGLPTASTAKPLFFTPITSSHASSSVLSSAEQATPSSEKPSAFTAVTSTQSTNPNAKPIFPSVTSSSAKLGNSSIFGSVAVSSTDTKIGSSTSAGSQPTGVLTAAGLSSNLFNVSSTEPSAKPSIFSTSCTTTVPTSSIFGTTTNSSSGFSFLAGTKGSTSIASASVQASTASTIFAPVNTQPTTKTPTDAPSVLHSSVVNTSTVTSNVTTGSIFGASSTSKFGTSTNTASTSTGGTSGAVSISSSTSSSVNSGIFGTTSIPVSSAQSAFSGLPATTSSSSSNFGVSADSVATSSSGSLFGSTSPATTKSIFGAVATSSQPVFGATMSSPFGQASNFDTTTAKTTSTSIFGNSISSSTSPFGSASTPAFGSGSSTFGAPSSSSATVFGPPATTSASPFSGSPFAGIASSSAPFGTAVSTASPFAAVVSPSTSPFATGSTSPGPIFAAVATTASPFAASATTAASPFAGAATSSSIFGGTTTSSSSLFGASTTAAPPVFGKQSVFGQPSGFGNGFGSTSTTSSSVFGQPASGGSSIFGNTASNVFGGTTTSSAFGTASTPFGTTSPSGGTSPFGQTSSSGGLFGSSQSVFGSASNTENAGGSFGFGSLNVGASTQSPFSKTTETKSPFGGGTFNTTASTGSLFGSSSFGNSNSGSIFGQSTFGSAPTFGSTQQQSGPFSSGSGSVAQAGFGATPTFQKPAGFGAQPSFGGSPAFGTAPTFGGAPTFGNTSPFGSPNKVFGSSSPTGVFGASSQQSTPGFGNLANQNTIGFGNLAQQSTNNSGQSAPFSGSSSFSSWR